MTSIFISTTLFALFGVDVDWSGDGMESIPNKPG